MNHSVLIIEDDIAIRDILIMYLEMRGFKTAGSDNIVIEKLSFLPDIILMDVSLSGRSGKDICKSIKNNPETSHIPVIMMSASPAARQPCIDAGADTFINKPFQLAEIVATINTFIKN